jgi:hypothetical protein
VTCADIFKGQDYDYQTLNLTFAVNVVKFGLIISLFPKPLKLCVVSSVLVPLSPLKPTLVSFHGYYRTSPSRFNKKLNTSDLWLRNDLRRWRSMGMTGMISRFVRPLYPSLVPYSTVDSQEDMLMWLMSEAKGVERSLEGVARRLLLVNFAAIHTTSLVSDDVPHPL